MKPGIKTTEFWLTFAAGLLGAFLASGLLPDSHPAVQIAGIALLALGSLGYSVSRGLAKRGQ